MKKHNKIISVLLSAVMSLSLCGCSQNSIPADSYRQFSSIGTAIYGIMSTAKVDSEHREFAEKCFEDIDVYGAKLTLPMNVSDLPEEFTIEGHTASDSTYNGSMYNGYIVDRVDIICDGRKIAYAEIMYSKNKTYIDGQIVSLEFGGSLLDTDVSVFINGEYGFPTMERATELFGECEYNTDMVYDLGGGKTIKFWYMYFKNEEESHINPNALSVKLSVIGSTL